jgi:hypothetical protein
MDERRPRVVAKCGIHEIEEKLERIAALDLIGSGNGEDSLREPLVEIGRTDCRSKASSTARRGRPACAELLLGSTPAMLLT